MPKTKKTKKLTKKYKFSLLHASIFILIFAILGGYFVWKSLAYTTSSVQVNFAPVGIANAGTNSSYWLVSSDGGVFAMGGAPFYGSLGSSNVRDIVGIASTPDHRGYWLVGSDGGVFAFGDAQFHGSSGQVNPSLPAGGSNSFTPNYPVTGIAPTPNGGGYWLIAQDGGLFAFGNAPYAGSNNFTPAWGAYDSGIASTPDGGGYWELGDYGSVSAHGDATSTYNVPFNTLSGIGWNNRLVGIASTPDGHGYWLVGADGGVFAFGDAAFYGSMGGKTLNAPMVGIAATADGKGYWLVGADGGVFAFGDAVYQGGVSVGPKPVVPVTPTPPPSNSVPTNGSSNTSSSINTSSSGISIANDTVVSGTTLGVTSINTGSSSLSTSIINTPVAIQTSASGIIPTSETQDLKVNYPVVGINATATNGYNLIGADGGVFSEGSALNKGSLGGKGVTDIVGSVSTPDHKGYWLVGADGGVFAYGDAAFYGSMGGKKLNAPMVGIAATADGKGYWLVGADGGVFAYGDAAFYGSMGGTKLNQPIVGIASSPDSKGYLLVAKDGGVFAFGDAAFYGSMGGKTITGWVTGISMTPDGKGYFLVGSDGAVFAFGDAAYSGRVVYPPPAVTFIASAPNNRITQGSPITLAWTTSNNALAVVFISGPGIFGQYPLNGNTITYPANIGENVYNLVVIGAGGYVSTNLTINVLPPPPQVNIYFNPSSVTSGGAATLVWSTSNATSISISGIGAVGPSGAIPLTGLTAGNDSYTISAVGPNGSVSATATMNVVNVSTSSSNSATLAAVSPAGLAIPTKETVINGLNMSIFQKTLLTNNYSTSSKTLLCLDYNYASGHLPSKDGYASLLFNVSGIGDTIQNPIVARITLSNNSLGPNDTATNCTDLGIGNMNISKLVVTNLVLPAYTSLRGIRLLPVEQGT